MKMVCPYCGLGGTADAGVFQRRVRCPECQKVFRVTEAVLVDLVMNSSDDTGIESIESQPAKQMPAVPSSDSVVSLEARDERVRIFGLTTCSRCGFQLSGMFMKVIDEQPVCAACAG